MKDKKDQTQRPSLVTQRPGDMASVEALEELLEAPEDDLDREVMAMAEAIAEGRLVIDEPVDKRRQQIVDTGRAMAVFSHFSVVFGLPVFLVVLYQRDNAFALHHAKAAGAIYLAALTMLVAAAVNCALFLPLVFLCYIPALIGIYRAAAGVEAGEAALGNVGEKVFSWLHLKKSHHKK